jgi:hypothetical protein
MDACGKIVGSVPGRLIRNAAKRRFILLPYIEELKKFNVDYFVDATPNFLGRGAELLEKFLIKQALKLLPIRSFMVP